MTKEKLSIADVNFDVGPLNVEEWEPTKLELRNMDTGEIEVFEADDRGQIKVPRGNYAFEGEQLPRVGIQLSQALYWVYPKKEDR